MTIDTKYELKSKHLVTVEGGTGAFLITAMSIRVNSKNDIRRIYEGTLYEHGTDQYGKVIRWANQRPYAFEEKVLDDNKQPAPVNKAGDMGPEV